MKSNHFFLINIFLLLLIGCSEMTLPKEMPEDFEFRLKYGYGAKNNLNTFDNTFTKDLIDRGQVEVDLQLTKAELIERKDYICAVTAS
ncbi:hypothetical protein [Alkalihalobacillus sp. 1P02AB]|uniref:hypothetical protein n=1 Tax=Alkalihalobacillus sp. 1P02AB TaxID=3132260 RepID=UPI0039A56616